MAESKPKGCIIRVCSCKHEFQDNIYGSQQRVFNIGEDCYRCTVCKNEIKIKHLQNIK